ncbi:hypothetical protein PBAL39_20229 [Pedobacter sp. BAL39]|uniref:helix-turn-helix domain-containing protein n=1 Tax=Pedobacter sp. BAL39 TaxID=391596 RepID=UPI000155993B|nr:helix-turn-helix domain-containing protein [Pedobacter sp. BAL39]EDM36247.1 hypothetical protein PBAL39_20229 [Pedobacter sp. BAL39]
MKYISILLKLLINGQKEQLSVMKSMTGFFQKLEEKEEEYLSTKEVLMKIDRSPRTLDYWIERKILIPIKINGSNRFRKSDVIRLLREGDGQ